MPALRFLGLKDTDEWRSLIAALPLDRRDIHYDPDLLGIYEEVYGWPALLAYMDLGGSEFIIQPFLREWNGRLRHAYNFGGPIGTPGCGLDAYSDYYERLREWKRAEGIVHEYCTFNPMLPAQLELLGGFAQDLEVKDVVWMDLGDIKLRSTTRHMIDKASAAQVRATSMEITRKSLDGFNYIYQETMNRRGASDRWKFPHKFFATHECLREKISLLFVTVGGTLESACLLIHDHGTAYYHYAGWLGNFHNIGVNHLMVLAAAMHARDKLGCKRLHLGGGLTNKDDDGLFVFKSGFSPLRAPLYVMETTTEAPTTCRSS